MNTHSGLPHDALHLPVDEFEKILFSVAVISKRRLESVAQLNLSRIICISNIFPAS